MTLTREGVSCELEALRRAGGLTSWSIYTTPAPLLEQLKAVTQRLNGSRRRGDVEAAIRAVLEEALDELEPEREGAAARELFGVTPEARPLKHHPRIALAAKAWSAGAASESSYRKTYMSDTLDRLADWLLDDDDAAGEAATNGSGPLRDLDAGSSLNQLLDGLRRVPAIDGRPLTPLAHGALDVDLRQVLAASYHTLRFLDEHQTFLSRETELELRRRASVHDGEDWLYVLARRDLGEDGFVQQEGWERHVDWLRDHVRSIPPPPPPVGTGGASAPYEDGVKQVRVVIATTFEEGVAAAGELCSLHRTGTLFWFPQGLLSTYEHLGDLRYGMTVSQSHRYALVTVPPTAMPPAVWVREPSGFVRNCLERALPYDRGAGDMRAVVTASDAYVRQLRRAFEQLIQSPYARPIPCGSDVRTP
jgi:hypothetical protein